MGRRKGDFNEEVKHTLFREVNGHCAAPGCDKFTSAGKAGQPGKAYSTGRAAHICAASKKGPRYDPNLSEPERKSSANGIWLCGHHADEIDADKGRFSAPELREWKREAIERARSRIDTKPYRYQDAIDLVRQLLPIAGHVPRPLSGAVHDLIRTEDMALQALDPRFIVESEFRRDGQRVIYLSAADEPIDINMTITGSHVLEFWEQHQRREDHGIAMSLPTDAFRFDGSQLFAELFSVPGGTLCVGPKTRKALNTFELHQPTTGEVKRYEPFMGTLQYGQQSVTFEGSACDGIFKLSYQCLRGSPVTFPQVTLAIHHVELWEGRPIAHLPYLACVLEIFTLVAAGWRLHTALMIEGKNAFSGDVIFNLQQKAFFETDLHFLEYTSLCQQLAKRCGIEVHFMSTITFTLRQLDEMRTVLRLFAGAKLECGQHNAPVGLEHPIPQDIILFEQPKKADDVPESIVCTRRGGTLDLFGTKHQLPDTYIELTSVLMRYSTVTSGNGRSRVRVVFERAPDCRCFAYYERRHWPPHLVPERGFADDAS